MAYKVLVICGSPHLKGCTNRALEEVCKTLNAEGVETEWVSVGKNDAHGCLGCGFCSKNDRCVFDDGVNVAARLLQEADGLLIGSPVHYGSPGGALLGFLDRLFYSADYSMHMKVGAAVVSCRRGGNSASFDVLNKYFTISGMPVASSTYWNQVHGFKAEDVEKDLEGLQTMRNLGRNMSFLIKAIGAEKEKSGLPKVEREFFTSFPDGK